MNMDDKYHTSANIKVWTDPITKLVVVDFFDGNGEYVGSGNMTFDFVKELANSL